MGHKAYQFNAHRQMVNSDVQGGSIVFNTHTYDATGGVFDFRQDLVNGGFSKHASATVEVANEDLNSGETAFHSGQAITVTPAGQSARNCRIESFTRAGGIWHIHVVDINEGA